MLNLSQCNHIYWRVIEILPWPVLHFTLIGMYFTIINIHDIHSIFFFWNKMFTRMGICMGQYHLYDNLPWTDNNRRLLTKPGNHLIFKAWSSGNGKRLGFSHFSGTGANGVEKPNITLSNNRLSLPRIRGKRERERW